MGTLGKQRKHSCCEASVLTTSITVKPTTINKKEKKIEKEIQ